MNIISQDALHKPTDLEDFIVLLRRYRKGTIVDSGRSLLWKLFFDSSLRQKYEQENHLIQAYGPRIIMLALATANNFRSNTIGRGGFYDMCKAYLQIPTSISDEGFLESEAREILKILEVNSKLNEGIPLGNLDFNAIHFACSIMFVSRGLGIQHQSFHMGIEEFYTDAKILKFLDEKTDNEVSRILQNKFGASLIQVLRSAWCIFTLAGFPNNNGLVDFDVHTFLDEFVNRFDVKPDVCKRVALGLSCNESELRAKWLEEKVLSQHTYYQQFYPDPLFDKPIVKLDKSGSSHQYLLPSPALFIRGFRQAIFSIICSGAQNEGKMGRAIGESIEEHIQFGLYAIFGEERVSLIKGEGKHADFLIKLETIDLIIEVKTAIGGFTHRSVMNPMHVADIWKRLYGACVQCAHSLAIHSQEHKLTIPIVIVADHFTAEPLPFHFFAKESGIYGDLNIEAIEFYSWNSFEFLFSGTSVREFEKKIIERWASKENMSVEKFMDFSVDRSMPAHKYEYLNDVKVEIFLN